MTKEVVNHCARFMKQEKPFSGFHSTWISIVMYESHVAKQLIQQWKKHPYMTNIQYHKKKYWEVNSVAISFKTEADEAAFMLYSTNGIDSSYEIEK